MHKTTRRHICTAVLLMVTVKRTLNVVLALHNVHIHTYKHTYIHTYWHGITLHDIMYILLRILNIPTHIHPCTQTHADTHKECAPVSKQLMKYLSVHPKEVFPKVEIYTVRSVISGREWRGKNKSPLECGCVSASLFCSYLAAVLLNVIWYSLAYFANAVVSQFSEGNMKQSYYTPFILRM